MRSLPVGSSILPSLQIGRRRSARWLAILVSVSSLLGLVLLGRTNWDRQAALFALMVVSLFSFVSAVQPRQKFYFSFEDAPAAAALALLGPLPAALVFSMSDLGELVFSRHRLTEVLENAAGGLVALLAGALLLSLLTPIPFGPESGPPAYLALFGVSLAVGIINYLAWASFDRLDSGTWRQQFQRTNLLLLLALALTLVISCTATALYFQLGPWALLLQIPPLIGVSLVLPVVLRDQTPVAMPTSDVVTSYAVSIAECMALGKREKRILREAASHAGNAVRAPNSLDHFEEAMNVLLYSRERWDGKDSFPGAVGGESIPIESRVLAVATAWAEISCTEGAGQDTAVANLVARAGTEFDPRVVAAAKAVDASGTAPSTPGMWMQSGFDT